MQQDPNYGRQDEESRLRRVPLGKDDASDGGGSNDPYGGSRSDPFGGTGGSMGTVGMAGQSGTMSIQDEKTWSMVAHLTALAGLIGLMPFGALIVWLIYKDKSPRVGFHAAQALWYQLAWVAIWIVAGIVGFFFVFITLGFGVILAAPLGLVLWLAPVAHGCYAAYKVNQGVDYRYPFIADMVDSRHQFG